MLSHFVAFELLQNFFVFLAVFVFFAHHLPPLVSSHGGAGGVDGGDGGSTSRWPQQ